MKSPFHDIVPPDKRSIRNIPLPEGKTESKTDHTAHHAHKHKRETHKSEAVKLEVSARKEEAEEAKEFEEQTNPWAYEPKEELRAIGGEKSGGMSKLSLWGIAIVSVAVLFFAITWLFGGATVHVALKKVPVVMPGALEFSLQPKQGEIGYSTLSLSESDSVTLKATGTKEANESAKGTIIIYNNYNAEPQKLVAGTRFQTQNGLIYKIQSPVTVPGKKGTTAGSVTADVMAEKPGADYNSDLTDFTIPGFKGTPQFDGFYARSKTAIAGGSSGTIAVVDEADKIAAIEELKKSLKKTLEEKVKKELPATATSFANLAALSYTVSDPIPDATSAKVDVKATMKLYLIDTLALTKKLFEQKSMEVLPSDTFTIDTTDALIASWSEASSTLAATITGNAVIRYELDEEKFKEEIKGKSKDELVRSVAAKYPSITTISTEIKPFWRTSLPENIKKIEVIEE